MEKIKNILKNYNLSRFVWGLVVIVLFLLNNTNAIDLPFLNAIENRAYDMRLNFTMPNEKDYRVVIIDIDEKTMEEQGRWPWSRDKVAALNDALYDDYFVSAIAYDVLFIEEDNSTGKELLDRLLDENTNSPPEITQTLANIRSQMETDRIFAESMVDREIVLGFYLYQQRSPEGNLQKGQLPAPLAVTKDIAPNLPLMQAIGYGSSLAELTQSAMGGGFISLGGLDDDGVIRRAPMIAEYNGRIYPSLSLAALTAMMGNQPVEFFVAPGYEGQEVNRGLERIEVGGLKIPVDATGALFVPYRGAQGSFTYISATDVLNHRVDPKILDGTIALVGTSAAGLMDLRSTPMQNVYPGVEVHANIISGVLDERILQRPDYIQGAEFVLMLALGLLMLLTLPWMSALWVTLFTVLIMGGLIAFNLYTWNHKIFIPLAPSVVLVFVLFIKHVSYGYFFEQKNKRRLHKSFGQYVPPELVDEMSETGGNDFTMEADSRELTVLFSDVRGFTTLSEGLEPKQLSDLMNQFLTPMTRVIHNSRGTIDKYMGDAIMAFWGAPVKDDKHALHAVDAAIKMVRVLPDINDQFHARGWPAINIGVGINTGIMSVGNMGSEFRMAYTVLGDAVNLGSRLEGLTKKYGVRVILSESTRKAIAASSIVCRTLDKVKVVGKDEAVEIFEPLGYREELTPQQLHELEQYSEALDQYRQREWQSARRNLEDLLKQHPDTFLFQMYLNRIAEHIAQPPAEDWDFVYAFSTK